MLEVTNGRYNKESQKALRSFVKGVPDAFFIFAGAMEYNESKGEYVTGSFSTHDENSVRTLGIALPSGGRDRVLTAFEMHRVFPGAYLVTMSKTRDESKPTYAYIAKKELIEKGVDQSRILCQDTSIDTVTEIKEAACLSFEHGWHNIVFVVSKWQIPRAEALLNHIEDFADRDEKKIFRFFADSIKNGTLLVQFLDTTAVLSEINDDYKRFFQETLAVDLGMQTRIFAEENSVRQIAEGAYGGKRLTHKIWEGKP